ncbi:DNA polymerase III subunit gamma/tau [Piscinibacter sp. Jin2]|uniref:DNA polymerase III subunit gamma/tau n=1 Tax=Aquariibacter lacus TaxID=2801332 RepID=A0A9X0XE77_9BURK|nr:DNA polymerase III subunit gamma/tau [Piscinibacter lacus]MBL0719979.1 DNA polymerase III subunit gamma/tau [Piscinibacter lacus]
MTTLVLARKYRPRRFDEMVGQEHVVQALANALRSNRLHHAYLFTGTRGVGKTTVSRILAKSLNCVGPDGQGGVTDQPCGVCNHCRDIDAGRHVDYTELDAASNRGVEEIGQLLDRAVYKPVLARTKVYLIDEVHMLSSTAFNAMLKTLEEPPEHLKFVLATTDPQKLPITVLSRCLQFNLRPMAPETVREHLARVLAAEAIPAEPGALRLLARAARGSMRDALSLTDQAIAYGNGALAEEEVRTMLGAVDDRLAESLVEALAEGDGARVVQHCDRLRDEGLSAEGMLEAIATLCQRMAVQQAVPGALDADDPEQAAALALAARLPADETQLLYGLALQGRAELALAPDEFSGLLMVLLRFLAFRLPPDAAPRASAAPEPAARPRATPSAALRSPAPPAVQIPVPLPRPDRPEAAAPSDAALQAAPKTAEPARHLPQAAGFAGPAAPAATAQVMPPAEPAVPRPAPAAVAPKQSGTASAALRVLREPAPWDDEVPHPALAQDLAPQPATPALRPPAAEPDEAPSPSAAEADWHGAPPVAEDEARALPAPQAEAEAAAPPARIPAANDAPAAPDSPLGAAWAALVDSLIAQGAVAAMHRQLAWQAQCTHLEPEAGRVHLRIDRESLRSPMHIERLQAALAAHWQRPVVLAVEAGPVDDSPARREAADRLARQQAAEMACEADPLVQALLGRHRGARLLPGTLQPR